MGVPRICLTGEGYFSWRTDKQKRKKKCPYIPTEQADKKIIKGGGGGGGGRGEEETMILASRRKKITYFYFLHGIKAGSWTPKTAPPPGMCMRGYNLFLFSS